MEDKVISVAEMRAADRYTIDELGVPSTELMRRAAQGVFDAVFTGGAEADPQGKQAAKAAGENAGPAVIFCGSGNNGGDGYALAEIMADHGMGAVIVRVSEKFSEDGKFYYDRCSAKDVTAIMLREFDADAVGVKAGTLIFDCMLGTGFSGVPREPVSDVIRMINEARENGAYVVSVDINSGMNGDTGEAELAVKSDLTVSIGYYKTGFFTEDAKAWIGELVNAEIGIELVP